MTINIIERKNRGRRRVECIGLTVNVNGGVNAGGGFSSCRRKGGDLGFVARLQMWSPRGCKLEGWWNRCACALTLTVNGKGLGA